MVKNMKKTDIFIDIVTVKRIYSVDNTYVYPIPFFVV